MARSSFDVIVVGGGVAGVKAAVTAKKLLPSASVALISNETLIYARPALRSVISGSLKSVNDIVVYKVEDLEGFKIKFFPEHEVSSINHDERVIHAKNRFNDNSLSLTYDKLILATGSVPATPPVDGSHLQGVFTVKWLDETLSLSQYITPGMKAYVVGAGFIGLEVAEALARRGLKTTLIESVRVLWRLVEPDISQEITRRIKSHGINVLTGVTIEEVGGKRKVEYVVVEGKKFPADVVVFATGMRPNTSIASQIGLKLGETNAIKTDTRMETSLENIYAAGDCAETIDLITGKSTYRPIGSIATLAAEVAGSNAVGVERSYNGFLRMQYDEIFHTEVVSVGLSTEEARRLGVDAKTVDACLKNVNHPLLSQLARAKVLMKVVVERGTDTIIGWQCVGSTRSSWASLHLSEMIQKKCNVSEIQELGLSVE